VSPFPPLLQSVRCKQANTLKLPHLHQRKCHCPILLSSTTKAQDKEVGKKQKRHRTLSMTSGHCCLGKILSFTIRSKPLRSQSVHPTRSGRRSQSEGPQASDDLYMSCSKPTTEIQNCLFADHQIWQTIHSSVTV